jgi:predicted PurR-regulated permease PerM
MAISQSKPELPARLAIVLVTIAVAALFVSMVRGFLIALFLAAVFSAMAYPLYRRIAQAVGDRPAVAAGLTLALLISAALLPGIALLILISEQAQDVAKQAIPWAQQYMQDATGAPGLQIPEGVPFSEQIEAWLPEIAAKLGELSSKLGEFVVQTASAATSGAAQFFLNLFVMLYAMFFFLSDGPALVDTLRRYAMTLAGVQERVFQRAVVVARATIKGTLVIGIVQGALGGIGLAMFGIGGAAFWGAVMAVASMLPVVGTSLVWIPAVLYLLATGETTSAMGLALWSAIIVSNVDNILRPILVGGDTEMPDLLVLIATFGGLSMFGGTGLILGPVVAAVFMTLLEITYETLQQPSNVVGSAQSTAVSSGEPNERSVEAETANVDFSDTRGETEVRSNEQAARTMKVGAEAPSASTTSKQYGEHGLLDVALSDAQRIELRQLAEEVGKLKAARQKS